MITSVVQCRGLLHIAERAITGLGDEHRSLEPAVGAKTAGWLVGHLVVTGDFARRLCGRSPMSSTEWRTAFNPGTTPSLNAADYPPMAELCQGLRAVYSDLCEAALAAPPELLEADNPYAPMRGPYPTAGAFVAYIAAGHFGYHLGQLVTWRAVAGLGSLPRSL